MAEERRYTLAEARIELHKEECVRTGHDYNIILARDMMSPASIHCLRCGRSWLIAADPT